MNFISIRACFILALVSLFSACAQVMAPTGGQKDITPPKLLEVTPEDSLLNSRVTRINLRFDEFLVLSNAASEVTISPILPFPLDISFSRKSVTVKIPDSLLQPNTTYRISFGKAIQDLHENNPFTGYNYTFSTGNYFDSLSLNGYLINAATGLKDSGALIVLHDASKSDSAVVREKPLYAVKADNAGNFRFEGLPEKAFRIYAIRDANNNMIYDGSGEMIAFLDSTVLPNTQPQNIRLNIFEEIDTADNVAKETTQQGRLSVNTNNQTTTSFEGFTYVVNLDTSDTRKRTVDITKPFQITFNKPIQVFNANRINLSYDSAAIFVEAFVNRVEDTLKKNVLLLNTNLKEDVVYTLRLLKGFAQDSAGTDAMPSRYTFRTKRDDDYAKLHVHLPSKYYGDGFVFVLQNGNDTIYQRAVTDTMIHFTRLQPANYSMRVIVDKNKNGKWDPGYLLDKIQPEEVIPYLNPIMLKAGWENMVDFEEEKKANAASDKLERITH